MTLADNALTTDAFENLADAEDVPELSLRAQLTIWFALSYGVILSAILVGVIVLDGGRIFTVGDTYDLTIRLAGTAFLAALLGGTAAAWVIVGSALEPLRSITETARGMAPESIEASRIAMPELGTEVNAAKRELNSALDRIEAGYQAQERFISNVSHELKTPIAIILNEAQRLRRSERDRNELETFVRDTADQMSHLGKMVESFLTLARIDYEEKLQKNQEFWFHDLIVEAVSRSSAQGMTHNVRIEPVLYEDTEFFDDPTWGDPELVSALVENLIRNAIRFSPVAGGAVVHVSLEGVEPDPNDPEARKAALIQVTDEGPGMPVDLIETVFQPFAQAETEKNTGRGTGLGLAIAQKVTDLHRGQIRAFNRRDGKSGCVLEVKLPFLDESDWQADRPITANLPEGGIGRGVEQKPR